MSDEKEFPPLTPKERALVNEITRTDAGRPRTKTEAYRRAYDPQGSNQTVTNEASRILKRPKIVAAIEKIEAQIEMDRRRASRGNAQAIQTALWNLAETAERESDRINALGKLITLLPKHPEDEGDSVSSKADAIEKLNRILEQHLPEAVDVGPVVGDAVPTFEDDEPLQVEAVVVDEPVEEPDIEPEF